MLGSLTISRAASLDIGHEVATELQEGWYEASIGEKAGVCWGGCPLLKTLTSILGKTP